MSCVVPSILAYFTLAYLTASLVYVLVTYIGRWGTPFKNSLSPEQLRLKRSSARKRGCLFGISFVVALIILFLTRPMMRRPE